MSKIIVLLALFSSFFIFTAVGYAEDEKKEAVPLSLPTNADYGDLRLIGTVKINQVIDALTLRLDDGRIIQLSAVDFPDLTPYEAGDIALAAHKALSELLTGKSVRLYQTKKADKGRTNRMSNELAHIDVNAPTPPETSDTSDTADKEPHTIWAQGYLILNGLARARPNERNPEMAVQMYALEQIAREKKVGMWNPEKYPAMQVLTPDTADTAMNSFAVIEGTIKSVAMVKNVTYLNFGNNWRDDFTIAVESATRRQMLKEKPDMNLLSLGGSNVRVRGWVESYNGAFIKLEHPALIEFLPETTENTSLDTDDNN